jgi:hypothetical protein
VRSLQLGWYATLEKRFKPRATEAIAKVMAPASVYCWRDVRAGRSITEWAQNMLRDAQAAEMSQRLPNHAPRKAPVIFPFSSIRGYPNHGSSHPMHVSTSLWTALWMQEMIGNDAANVKGSRPRQTNTSRACDIMSHGNMAFTTVPSS